MKQIEKEVLTKIKKDRIKPRPRWQYTLKNYLIYLLFVSTIIAGGFATSVLIYRIINHDWDIYRYIHIGFMPYLLANLPYIWIGLLAVLIGLSVIEFQKTKKGYKSNIADIIIVAVILSLMSGIGFYVLGAGRSIDDGIGRGIPRYQPLIQKRIEIWSKPEDGLLAGEITEIKDLNNLILRDLKGNQWLIFLSAGAHRGQNSLKIGDKIRLMGEQTGANMFRAFKIHIWPAGQGKGLFAPKNGGSSPNRIRTLMK